jgi:hypothetical protein
MLTNKKSEWRPFHIYWSWMPFAQGHRMNAEHHRRITAQALEKRVSPAALKIMIAANLGQDAVMYQIGHDHFHYDNSSFQAGDAYLAQMRRAVIDALGWRQPALAWQAFGRLLHAAQDFYAHSNYTTLWRERYPDAAPDQISPLFVEALTDPRLYSGRLYYPLEALCFIPALQPVVLPWIPRDSHAWMHKDDPSRPDFAYAYSAAVKRSALEFQNIIQLLPASQVIVFTGQVV